MINKNENHKWHTIMFIVTIITAAICFAILLLTDTDRTSSRTDKISAGTKVTYAVESKTTYHYSPRTDMLKKSTKPAVSQTTTAKPTKTTASTTKTTPTTTCTETTPVTTYTETTTTQITNTEPTEPTEEPITYSFYDDWTWIGDSRTVGMSQCVNINSFAKSAMGLNWFIENSETIYNFRYQTIVINLGVNDLGNVYNYIDTFNNMPDDFTKNNCIYIMSVNPVDEEKEKYYNYYVQNSSIEQFNNTLRDNLRSDFFFIDTYEYMQNNGFDTVDGLHYDYNTYVNLYNYMIYTITGAE